MCKKPSSSSILRELCYSYEFDNNFVRTLNDLIKSGEIKPETVHIRGRSTFLYIFEFISLYIYIFGVFYFISTEQYFGLFVAIFLWYFLGILSATLTIGIFQHPNYGDNKFFDILLSVFLPFIFVFYTPFKKIQKYKSVQKISVKKQISDIISNRRYGTFCE